VRRLWEPITRDRRLGAADSWAGRLGVRTPSARSERQRIPCDIVRPGVGHLAVYYNVKGCRSV